MRQWSLALAIAGLSMACDDSPPEKPTPSATPGLQMLKAKAGQSAPEQIASAQAKARAEGRKLVVYVGATWCEPCMHFKRAAKAGELDMRFPKLSVLEFDRDRDEAGLREASCLSRLIPLFAVPTDDGHCSDRRIEGSIKGDGAVAEISPRLASLLER